MRGVVLLGEWWGLKTWDLQWKTIVRVNFNVVTLSFIYLEVHCDPQKVKLFSVLDFDICPVPSAKLLTWKLVNLFSYARNIELPWYM